MIAWLPRGLAPTILAVVFTVFSGCKLVGSEKEYLTLSVSAETTSTISTLTLSLANDAGYTVYGGGICNDVFIERLVGDAWSDDGVIAPLAVCVANQPIPALSTFDWRIDYPLATGVYRFSVDIERGQQTERVRSNSVSI